MAIGLGDSITQTFQMINTLVGGGMTIAGFFSLGKGLFSSVRTMAGKESTAVAGEHVRRWGRNLSKKDEKIWSYNKIANKLVVDMKRGDDDIERRLERIKESLEELKKIDENPDLVPEGGLIQ